MTSRVAEICQEIQSSVDALVRRERAQSPWPPAERFNPEPLVRRSLQSPPVLATMLAPPASVRRYVQPMSGSRAEEAEVKAVLTELTEQMEPSATEGGREAPVRRAGMMRQLHSLLIQLEARLRRRPVN